MCIFSRLVLHSAVARRDTTKHSSLFEGVRRHDTKAAPNSKQVRFVSVKAERSPSRNHVIWYPSSDQVMSAGGGGLPHDDNDAYSRAVTKLDDSDQEQDHKSTLHSDLPKSFSNDNPFSRGRANAVNCVTFCAWCGHQHQSFLGFRQSINVLVHASVCTETELLRPHTAASDIDHLSSFFMRSTSGGWREMGRGPADNDTYLTRFGFQPRWLKTKQTAGLPYLGTLLFIHSFYFLSWLIQPNLCAFQPENVLTVPWHPVKIL